MVSHDGEFAHALELTERSDALYAELDRPWDQAANWLFAARAAISAGDRARAAAARDQVEHWLARVDDPWLHVRGEAMLGELARLEHRFDDAVLHLGRAAETSGRLGFLQTEAYQLSSLGRAQCQAGDYEAGAATLELAIEKAEATGDVRMAALARVHLGRVLRALGRTRRRGPRSRPRRPGTVTPAVASRPRSASACWRRSTPTSRGSPTLLDDARRDGDAPVEVFALDALARLAADAGTAAELSAAADRRMPAASHFITERDRTDRPAGSARRTPAAR